MLGIDGMARQDRHQAEDERQLAVGGAGEVEAHGPLGERSGAGDLDVIGAVIRTAVIPEQFPGEDDVGRGHRRAVGERCSGIEIERHIGPLGVGLDRAGQEAVQRERLVIAAHQQAFEHAATQLRRRESLDDEGIEAVERAEHAAHEAAALGRIGIDVAEGGEALRERRLSMHGDGMSGLRRRAGGNEKHPGDKQRATGDERSPCDKMHRPSPAETGRSTTIADGRGVRHRVTLFRIDQDMYHTVRSRVRAAPV